MDVRQLKFFLAVVDHNGFSRAAQHLMVAQPSLSQAITTFEHRFKNPFVSSHQRNIAAAENLRNEPRQLVRLRHAAAA